MQGIDIKEILKNNPHIDAEKLQSMGKALEQLNEGCSTTSRYRLAMERRRVRVGGCIGSDARIVRLRNQKV